VIAAVDPLMGEAGVCISENFAVGSSETCSFTAVMERVRSGSKHIGCLLESGGGSSVGLSFAFDNGELAGRLFCGRGGGRAGLQLAG
jgi:hypothetical protein